MAPLIALLVVSISAAGAASPGRPTAHIERATRATAPQAPATQPPASGSGRVSVTLALEGVRIPAVNVELRSVDGNVVVAQTTSDAVGQVTFPDVPAGRYVVRAVRDGFADSESVAVHRRGRRDRTGARRDATDLRPRERGRRRARQLADREHAAGRGQRRADRREDGHPAAGRRRLPVAADGAAEHHPRSARAGCASRAARRRPARFR